ncbi:hypothetical protein [Trichothermofontia sp.]
METLVFGHFVSTSPWHFPPTRDRTQATANPGNTAPQPASQPATTQPTSAPATVAPSAAPPSTSDEPMVIVLPLF